MAHLLCVARLVLVLVPVLSLGAMGCVTEVTSGVGEGGGGEGGGGEGGGGEGGGGEGGGGGESQVCAAYTGAGCTPGEADIFCNKCQIVEGCETIWVEPSPSFECPSTPLVLSFDGEAVEFAVDATCTFDLNGAASQVTDWPTSRTPWLAFDRDASGAIENGSELFGSMSPLSSGRTAPNGFIALREHDENHDGRIDANDPIFSRLLVWADRDADRRTAPAELRGAGAVELESISLDYVSVPRCDARGNCEVERAPFVYRDAAGALRTGTVIDVHLPSQR
ncbi:calcium-binding protein [Polyangium sorediatum]|uniref:Calcium-binding protein n=1 Tax=Polyangium sorediatum TaxID=889274 RepID=A0ABT6NZQ9_9BACT|nr:calcium-binding protein [Polyangium sorediatum]MDI1433845.1 calcium-binding protein [Polyangium sorediatum]